MLLLGLFVFRVIAQLLVLNLNLPLLPPFDAWHSALLPYPTLVAAQIAIIAICTSLCVRMLRNAITPRKNLGTLLLIFGGIYFAVMLLRLTQGLTVLATHAWFAQHLPTVFHFVLASFVLVLGHFHFTQARGMYAHPA